MPSCEVFMYQERTMEPLIRRTSGFFPALLITGPRQVGKTSVLEHCAKNARRYVSLDSTENRALAKSDPRLFLERFPPPVLIDEAQYAPELFPYIKEAADRKRRNGLFWLTGSQQFNLMQSISETLAGRVGILRLQGFSQGEKDGAPKAAPFLPKKNFPDRRGRGPKSLREIFRAIWKGSYPALFLAGDGHWELFYSSYVQTYIERDVRKILNVSSELTFMKFMRAAAARTASLLDYASMSRDVGVSETTIKSWISVLNTSGIIYLLQPYSNNSTKRAVKTPKLYFMDTGLACHLTRWNNFSALEEGAYSGAIFETYVVSEILKSYWHNAKEPPVYFYRDKDMREIDIVINQNGKFHPVEIKKKSNPTNDDARHFHVIEDVLGQQRGHGAVVCMAPTHLPIAENVSAVPVWYI